LKLSEKKKKKKKKSREVGLGSRQVVSNHLGLIYNSGRKSAAKFVEVLHLHDLRSRKAAAAASLFVCLFFLFCLLIDADLVFFCFAFWICVFHSLGDLNGVHGGSISSIARWLAGWHDKFTLYRIASFFSSFFVFFWSTNFGASSSFPIPPPPPPTRQ
jgi:hypothetical protein